MILVLCGTQKQDFSRMIRAVEELADEHEVIVQGGHNQYESNKLKVLGFISRKEMNELYDQADYIITHAGGRFNDTIFEKRKDNNCGAKAI